jgi:xylulokinase
LFAHAAGCAVDPTGRIHAFAHSVPGRYCLLAVTLSAGGSLRWWRDLTGLGYEELVAEAETIQPGSEGLVFMPYLTGERTPHLDPMATGGFIGLTARHRRLDARADGGRVVQPARSRIVSASASTHRS